MHISNLFFNIFTKAFTIQMCMNYWFENVPLKDAQWYSKFGQLYHLTFFRFRELLFQKPFKCVGGIKVNNRIICINNFERKPSKYRRSVILKILKSEQKTSRLIHESLLCEIWKSTNIPFFLSANGRVLWSEKQLSKQRGPIYKHCEGRLVYVMGLYQDTFHFQKIFSFKSRIINIAMTRNKNCFKAERDK